MCRAVRTAGIEREKRRRRTEHSRGDGDDGDVPIGEVVADRLDGGVIAAGCDDEFGRIQQLYPRANVEATSTTAAISLPSRRAFRNMLAEDFELEDSVDDLRIKVDDDTIFGIGINGFDDDERTVLVELRPDPLQRD